ncbi:MAG: hypothetical protein M3155_06570 [Actinomycetota bacterium]|nr:hypothetical protein [Actinomycetota bacterium]
MTVVQVDNDFQIVAVGRVPGCQTPAELEEATEASLDVLLERAGDIALGAVASCNFNRNEIELLFTVEASSAERLHQRVGHVMRLLEEHGPFRLRATSASRFEPEVAARV